MLVRLCLVPLSGFIKGVERHISIIRPVVLILPIWWKPPYPLWLVEVVTIEEGIASGVRPPPSLAFTHSLKPGEACAASESSSGNVEQGGGNNDLCQ